MSRTFGYTATSRAEDAADARPPGTGRRGREADLTEAAGGGLTYADWGCEDTTPFADRRAAKAMLAEVEPGDVVVLPEVDRAVRSLAELAALVRLLAGRGVRLVCPDVGLDIDPLTAKGAAMADAVGSFAALSARLRRRGVRQGHALHRARGRAFARPPHGYRKVGEGAASRLVPDQYEIDLAVTIIDLLDGGMSAAAVAAELDGRGLRLRGRVWTGFGRDTARQKVERFVRRCKAGILTQLRETDSAKSEGD